MRLPHGCCFCCWLLSAIYSWCLIFLKLPRLAECYSDDQEFQQSEKPNIVIILMDDMGFNDASFHGSDQVVTSNIDALAYSGIILNNLYVPSLCTPSRASLLTGKYGIHTGMPHSVIINDEPWGLPLQEILMPEIFRQAGYVTTLVGKWHLGLYRKEMTPIYRGFDSHFGYYSGLIGYYDHTSKMPNQNYTGMDMRRDLRPVPEVTGIYATDLFDKEAVEIIKHHDAKKPLFMMLSHLAVHAGNDDNPLEAPQEDIEKFSYISDPKRRTYAAMIKRLDDSVGHTITALFNKGILNNTIILLYSDNGAPTEGIYANKGSNHPFRGQKGSPWEGGIRSAGLIWSPLLKQKSYVSNQVIHAIDWLPTLAAAAGVTLPKSLGLDGINHWSALSEAQPPLSTRLLHAFDVERGYISYMTGNLKYVNGSPREGKYDTWLGHINKTERDPLSYNYESNILNTLVNKQLPANEALTQEMIRNLRKQATVTCPFNAENYKQENYTCEALKEPCYFNLDNDPCERYNLAKLYPWQVEALSQEVEEYRKNMVPSVEIEIGDPLANPARFGGNWQWWYGT